MSPDQATPARGGAIKRWGALIALAVVGLLIGLAVGFYRPATYGAEARLSVAPGTSNAYDIAGFPLAANELASTYARWVTRETAPGGLPEGVEEVSASPIPDSAVVRIETTATSEEAAVTAAQALADGLVAQVSAAESASGPAALKEAFTQRAPTLADADAKAAAARGAYENAITRDLAGVERLRTQYVALAAEAATLRLEQDATAERYRRQAADPASIAQLAVVAPATSTGADTMSRMQRYGFVGLVAGGGLGLALTAALSARRGARERA